MAVELAQALIHEVVVDDSKAVVGAQNVSRAMDGMATASDKATAATTKQVGGLRLLDEATVKLSRAQESAWGALQKWKAVADDNERAMQRLARAEADLERAVRQGVATEEEKIRVLDQLRQKLSGYAVANDNAAASTGQFRGALGNMGLQLQDVAVQAQMGTSAFTILAQQGPQIASAFGPIGVAIGTVVAIASVAAGVLFTLGDETKKSAKEIDTFGDVLGVFEGRARESGAAIDTLTDSYRALGGELRALSKLALQADIATLAEKRAKDQKSAWDAIRNATMSGAQDIPAALGALQQLGQDKDLAAFMGKLQALNEKGAIKLMRDEDVRALLETGEALRVAEARMADLEGRATPAQKALLGYADAAREAAKATREAADAAYEMSRAQGLALGSVIVQERDLDRKIAALKGGEAAMKAYTEEQVRTAAYDKTFRANLAAGESLLDARTEATRIATKAVEAYRLEQQRADEHKATTKAESQAERDAKAYRRVSEELDRGIAEQQRLAGVVGQSVEAQRAANTETKIAEALSKAHTTASTAEGKAIADKVREQEKWRATAIDAAVLDSSKRQLAYAEKELSLMGQADPLRERALRSFQIQQDAQEKLKTTTPELVEQWVQYQEKIADTQALTSYKRQLHETAAQISRDWSETLYDAIILKDKNASILDAFRALGKRIALALLETNIVLPITTSIVGSVPGLFGIQSPANQNATGQGGMGGVGNLLSGASGLNTLSGGGLMDALFPGGGYSLTGAVDMFAANNLGIGTVMAGPTASGAAGYVSGGLTSMLGPMAAVAAGGATIGGLGAKMLGGNSTVGSVAGALTGGIPGALIGALFREPKPSNKEGNVSLDFAAGSATVGGQEGKKYSAENRQAAQGIGGQVQQLAATLEALLPGQQIAGRGLVAVGSRDGLRAEYGGQTASFGQQDTAGLMSWFTKQFAGDLKDGFERGDLPQQVADNLRAVLDRGVTSGVEQFVAGVQLAATNFATAFDALGKAQPDQIAGQITEVATSFVVMRDNAAKLGLSVDGLSASLKSATDRMIDSAIRAANGTGFIDQAMTIRATFEKVGQQLLSAGQDGSKAVQLYGAQMSALVNSFGEDENAIKNLGILADAMHGVDDVAEAFARLRIEQVRGTLTAKEQADAAAKLADEQAKAAEKMLAQADNLTAWLNGQALGDTSSLSPWAKMEEAQRQFDAALSTSRQNGDISGATKAADALLSASKPTLVMGTEAYTQREAWITSTLKNLGHELGLPGFATGGDHLGGLRIVGERGPELEWTGPSRIFSADQTRQILAGATSQAAPQVTVNVDMLPVMRAVSQSTNEVVTELRRLRQEVADLRAEKRTGINLKLAGVG